MSGGDPIANIKLLKGPAKNLAHDPEKREPAVLLDYFRFILVSGHRQSWARGSKSVESRCGAVALGRTYLLPPLSFGGASMVPPWLRFHIPLIEPDRQISRIRLSDKTSRLRVQRLLQLLNIYRS